MKREIELPKWLMLSKSALITTVSLISVDLKMESVYFEAKKNGREQKTNIITCRHITWISSFCRPLSMCICDTNFLTFFSSLCLRYKRRKVSSSMSNWFPVLYRTSYCSLGEGAKFFKISRISCKQKAASWGLFPFSTENMSWGLTDRAYGKIIFCIIWQIFLHIQQNWFAY